MELKIFFVLLAAKTFLLVGSQEAERNDELTHEILVSSIGELLGNENGVNELKAEFHRVPEGQRKPWTVASLPENLPKNRYESLLAYDETRVVLDPLYGDPFSTYINANYLDGYNYQKEYVATQGPLPNTINDFWRMIWQLQACRIVMLANVMEHGEEKVAKYWPETNDTYGDILVTKVSEHTVEDHVIRTFLLGKVGKLGSHVVRQFHYTGWPDYGVPSNKMSVVALVQQAKKYHEACDAPLVIHCSAGVGRTGTVILMDSMLERAKNETLVDLLKRLDHMRDQRVDVVEKEGQYLFVYEVLHQVYNEGNVTEYFQMIDEKYKEIDEVDENNNIPESEGFETGS